MRYDKDTYLFWIFGYLLLKGRFIRFMSGTKFKGTLIDRSAIRGSFSPSISKINFAVPSESALRAEADSLGIPRTIGPGIITYLIDILDKYSKNVVLSCDGKMIRRGLSKESGDVDLHGTEHGPSLLERQKRLEHEIDVVNECEEKLTEISGTLNSRLLSDFPVTLKTYLRETCGRILSILANRNCEIRTAKLKKEFTVQKIMKSLDTTDWKTSKYSYVISQLRCDCAKMDNFLKGSINNAKSASLMLREMSNCYIPSSLVKSDILDVSHHIAQLNEGQINPLHVRQGTEEWHNLRKQAPVTGSSFYDAIGLRSLKNQKEHIDRYVNNKEKEFDESTKKYLEWGRNNEQNAVATLVGYALPILYDQGLFAELGCSFISSPSNGN